VIDPVVTVGVESNLLRVLKYIHGVKLGLSGGHVDSLKVSKEAEEAGFQYEHIWDLVRIELRNIFPEIGPMKVSLILDHGIVESQGPIIKEYQAARKQLIDDATDESIEDFYGCTRCASFSLSHACTVSPERPSQCGSRPWYLLKTQALLSPDDVYNPSQVIPKGKVIDSIRGEYSGVNRSISERTKGNVDRIFMYSVMDFPHTACSCFQNIAYYIPEVDGVALVDRRYKGETPNGETWTSLANRVAGYQNNEGYATFATSYLRSPKFFQADGGYERVVWMTRSLKTFAGDSIPEDRRDKIKTEIETTKTEDLEKNIKILL
jgi:acetyl-CoA decarbonylase/synthase complex subunit beta